MTDIKWPKSNLDKLRSYNIRKVYLSFSCSWDGGISSYVKLVIPDYDSAEARAMSESLARDKYKIVEGIKEVGEKILEKIIDEGGEDEEIKYSDGGGGVLLLDVATGAWEIHEEE